MCMYHVISLVEEAYHNCTCAAFDTSKNEAYNANKMRRVTDSVTSTDHMRTLRIKSTESQAGYDDFSSLKSRVPMLVQRSAEGFRNHPDPTTSNATDESTASKDQTKLAATDHLASHPNHQRIKGTNSQAGYDDFSSLKSRVPMLVQSSAEGIRNHPNPTTSNITYENTASKDQTKLAATDHLASHPNDQRIKGTSQAGYDDFSSLKSRVPMLVQSNATYENIASKDQTKLAATDDNVSHPNHKGQKMVRDENTTNESKYEDFSVSLCSRVSRPMHSSARDLEDPFTTAANALQDPTVTKSTASETYEMSALVGEKKNEVVGYDDISTLSTRLAAQIQSSDGSGFEDHISTEAVS